MCGELNSNSLDEALRFVNFWFAKILLVFQFCLFCFIHKEYNIHTWLKKGALLLFEMSPRKRY